MKKPDIKVYSTPTCPYCTTLKMFLDEKQLKYKDLNIAIDNKARERMIGKTKQMTIPVIEINGKFVIGFDVNKIKKLLNINGN